MDEDDLQTNRSVDSESDIDMLSSRGSSRAESLSRSNNTSRASQKSTTLNGPTENGNAKQPEQPVVEEEDDEVLQRKKEREELEEKQRHEEEDIEKEIADEEMEETKINNALSSINMEDNNEAAIQIMNELLNANVITMNDFNFWKKKYDYINNIFFQIMEREASYLNKGKKLNKELMNEKKRLRETEKNRIDNQQYLSDLKRDLIKAENQLALSNESESVQQTKIIETERKINSLESDKSMLLESKDQQERPVVERLKSDVKDLKNSLREIQDRLKKEENNRVHNMETIKNLEVETQELHTRETELAKELNAFKREPDRAKKQSSIVQRALKAAKDDLNAKKEKLEKLDRLLQGQETKKEEVTKINYNIFIYGDNSRLKLHQIDKETNTIKSQQQEQKEGNNTAMADRVSINLDLQSKTKQLNNESEALKTLQKEEETQAKACKKTDDQIKDLTRDVSKQRKLLDNLLKERVHVRQLVEKVKEERIELDRDVELQIHSLLSDESEGRVLEEKLKQKEEKVKELEDKIKKSVQDERELGNRITMMEMEREKQAREATKQKNAFIDAMGEIKVNVFVNDELQKKLSEIEQQIQYVTQMYSLMKQDRNKYAKHIQDSAQALAEIREKNKILESEQEVLTKQCQEKDREVKKIQRQVNEELTQKSNLLTDYSKLKLQDDEKEKVNKEQVMEIEKLNMTINTTEELMLSLKRQYESGVQDRNYTGIQLIDRNDELCILYEKSNMQENLVTQGEVELNKKDQELRMLSLDLDNIKRELQIVYKKVPEFHSLRRMREELDKQIVQAQEQSAKLSKELENPQNKSRWRRLEGPRKDRANSLSKSIQLAKSINEETFMTGVDADQQNADNGIPSDEELRMKIQELEEKLNARKEQLMEKNLVIQEVTRSSDKLRNLAISGRDQTFDLAVSMNQIQGKIRDTNKKMMASMAELSLYKARSSSLLASNKALNKIIEDAKVRMDKGEPPSDEILAQFERDEELERKRAEEIAARKERMLTERDLPPTVTRTTAVLRPNSYIPDDTLGIPKPYNFKPVMWTEPGATMRHIRNPVPKKIVI
jgi:hypothetical protein